MPKKAQSTVKDLMIIAIFIFSLSSFTLSVYDHHQITNQNQNKNPTGYFMFHIPHWLHGHNSKNNNMEMPTKMFHPKPYKYNGPLTQQQVVEQTPAYHILKDIYTIINGKYYPIATKEGYINGSLIDLSTLTNKLSKEFVRKSGDVINGDLNMNNHDIKNVNEIDVKRLCLNGKCTTTLNQNTNTINKKLNVIYQYLLSSYVLPSPKVSNILYYYAYSSKGDQLCEQTYGQGWHWCTKTEITNKKGLSKEGILAINSKPSPCYGGVCIKRYEYSSNRWNDDSLWLCDDLTLSCKLPKYDYSERPRICKKFTKIYEISSYPEGSSMYMTKDDKGKYGITYFFMQATVPSTLGCFEWTDIPGRLACCHS